MTSLGLFVKYLTFPLGVSLVLQLYYWYFYFRMIINHPRSTRIKATQPTSIIICAKNELSNLQKNLKSVLLQDYRPLEVLIAEDHSTDQSLVYLEKIRKKWIDKEKIVLRIHKVNQNNLGKKQALQEAIPLSRHPWLLLTDADCKPSSTKWAATMIAQATTDKKDIVLGYSPVVPRHTWLSYWCHFESWITALQYLSFALKGQPYMGVGRNLAYKKSLYKPHMLAKYDKLSSGDDDLTIMQMANANNTTVCLDPISFVYTEAPQLWSAYFRQKRRHYSTASSYKRSTQWTLAGYSISHIIFYLCLIVALAKGQWFLALFPYCLRMLVIWPIAKGLINRLEASLGLGRFIIFDFVQSLYLMIFSFAVLFPQKKTW